VFLIGLLVVPLRADDVLRDPTRPPQSVEAAKVVPPEGGSWQVSSILFSSLRRVATVNGQVVQEGDRVDGARVTRIEAAVVYLQVGSRQVRIYTTFGKIKRPVNSAGREAGEP
jgi:hypothetical protein